MGCACVAWSTSPSPWTTALASPPRHAAAFIFDMWGVQNAVHCVGNMDTQQTPSRAALHASQLNALVCTLSSMAVFALKSAAQQSRGMELRRK